MADTIPIPTDRNVQDLTGMTFNRLTVIGLSHRKASGLYCWLCKCVCGNERVVGSTVLKMGHTKSCGCLNLERVRVRRRDDLTDKRFGRWVVLSYRGSNHWMCRCDCGTEREVIGTAMRRGVSSSCGCPSAELAATRPLKHGETRKTPEYAAWVSMKSRCCNPHTIGFENYGGRGISVCKRWLHSFENFLADMGRKPTAKHQLDRIDNDGAYCPENCRWATQTQQARNRRDSRFVTYRGEVRTIVEWAEILGVPYKRAFYRLSHGWSAEMTFTTPPVKNRKPQALSAKTEAPLLMPHDPERLQAIADAMLHAEPGTDEDAPPLSALLEELAEMAEDEADEPDEDDGPVNPEAKARVEAWLARKVREAMDRKPTPRVE